MRDLVRESHIAAYHLQILYNFLFLNIFIRLPSLNAAFRPSTIRWAIDYLMARQKDSSHAGTAMVKTVAGRELSDAVFEAAEVALDSVLDEGVLRELPIVGTLAKIARAGQSIAEELFLRKLLRFLHELRSIPADERAKLLERYPDGSDAQRDLGENLLLALERLDNVQKPVLLARFFAAYVRDQVDVATFSRLAQALERFNIGLLRELRWFYTREGELTEIPEEIEHELSLAGLVTVGLAGSGTWGGNASYRKCTLGELFLQIGFNVQQA